MINPKTARPVSALLAAWTLVLCLAVTPIATAADQSQSLNLSDYRGKVVVLDFWASWCVPCRRSFPWLNTMNDKYADQGLVIIGVNVDQEPASAAEFLEEYPARFQIRYDTAAHARERIRRTGHAEFLRDRS